jgi:3-hexulose-6-phosphate synthase
MRLQVAIDLVDARGCVDLVDKVHDVVDIAEVGTPIIMLEGVHAVEKLRAAYPHLCVLADTKIADGAKIEAGYACRAGADIVTVLATSDDLTVKGVIDEAHAEGREALVDLINVPDVIARSRQLDEMGADYICVHTASDVQATGKNPIEELKKIKSSVKKAKIACAGGINMSTIREIKAVGPDIVIIGGGITRADDPYAAAKAYYDIIHEA